jgi:hypothetical protein
MMTPLFSPKECHPFLPFSSTHDLVVSPLALNQDF